MPLRETRAMVDCEACTLLAKVQDALHEKFPDYTKMEHFALIDGVWHKIYIGEKKKLKSLCGNHPKPNKFHLMLRFKDKDGTVVHTDCFVNVVPEPKICEVCLAVERNSKESQD